MLSRRRFLKSTAAAGLALTAQMPPHALAQVAPARPRRIIVDAQIHLWTANTPERPWAPGARPQTPEPMTIERVVPLIDEAGVDRVVIVPPSLENNRLDYAQEAVKRYPGRFGIMGTFAANDPTTARRFATWRQQPGVLGLRVNIAENQAAWLTDGTTDWIWPAAEAARLPMMFLTTGQMNHFARIAERHPQLTLIIDHMGVSAATVSHNKAVETIDQSVALARFPNVSVKLSSVPLLSKDAYPFRDVTHHIRKLFDAYGPRRCHWGTDVTNSFTKATYKQRLIHFTEELNFLTEDDKDWIMGRSIMERLGWA